VLATAIWNEMSVDEVLSLDLSYAPPFAPVWDPVLIAARKAFEAVEADIARDVRRDRVLDAPRAGPPRGDRPCRACG
jgi:hypothetical protein